MSQRLQDKTAFVTGGTSGIGLATAKAFAAEGAKVIVLARSQEKADAAIAEIGHNSSAVFGDVTDLPSLKSAVDSIKETHGSLDVVVAGAGLGRPTPFADTTSEDFDSLIDVNFKSSFFTVQYTMPLLNKGASVILVSSCLNEMGVEGFSVYNATKSAVRSIARSLTPDMARIGARINVLSPGPIDTDALAKGGLSEEQVNEQNQFFASILPAGRVGLPEEMAGAALFLASDDSTFMLGSDLQADGGWNQTRIAMMH